MILTFGSLAHGGIPDDPTLAPRLGSHRPVPAMIGATTRRPPIDIRRSVPPPKVRVARLEPSPTALVSLAQALLLARAGGRATTCRPSRSSGRPIDAR
jgi:hypothetical protein